MIVKLIYNRMEHNSKKYIKIFALAQFQAIVLGFVGILCGLSYSFRGLIYDLNTTGVNQGTALAFLALFAMPAIGVIVGWVIGVIEVFLFNILVRFFNLPKIHF